MSGGLEPNTAAGCHPYCFFPKKRKKEKNGFSKLEAESKKTEAERDSRSYTKFKIKLGEN